MHAMHPQDMLCITPMDYTVLSACMCSQWLASFRCDCTQG